MIENIRKFKGLIIVGLGLVIFALVIGIKDDLFRRNSAGRGIIKLGGRTYGSQEYQHLGAGSFELASMLARSGDFELYQFVMSLSAGATNEKDAPEKFFIGRMIVRQAKEDFGIYPSDDEVSASIRTMKAFADKDGKFSEETYRNIVEKGIGRLGMAESDLRDLASDVLVSKKINEIVGTGLDSNRTIVATEQALNEQQITGSLARLSIDPFAAKINPTDDELKKYWEERQDAFTTEPKRKFTYIIATPDMPADPDAAAEAADDKGSIADAAATEEAKKKKEAEKAKKAAELADARRKKQIELDSMVDQFATDLESQKGEGLEDLAKANKWEVKTSELFARSTPPKDLDVKLRSSSAGGQVVDELFRIEVTSDPMSKISQPIAIGENQWLVARLDGEEKSRPKTFEEAKIEARVQYVAEKAAEAMKTAATEDSTKIKTLLTAGKSFADAAKEVGITEVKEITKVNSTYRPDAASEPKNLFEAAKTVDPGSLAEVITEADRAFIVFVEKREVVKEENAATRLDSEVKRSATQNQYITFSSWLADRIEAAKVELLYKQQ